MTRSARERMVESAVVLLAKRGFQGATMMIAASEGAVVLARAEQALAPLETVHRQLRVLAAIYHHE